MSFWKNYDNFSKAKVISQIVYKGPWQVMVVFETVETKMESEEGRAFKGLLRRTYEESTVRTH